MKRFRFRLEGLLRVRRLRERQGRRELADALRALREAEARCQTVQHALREAEQRLVAAQDALTLRGWAHAVGLRRRELAAAQAALMEARGRAQALWARFLQLRRERKVVEQVRERRWRQHQREQQRREQGQLDELALLRRGRAE